MSEQPEMISVTLQRVFEAPIERVYRAWTEAEQVVRWMKCDAAATLELENWVPAVGTDFKSYMAQEGVFEAWGTGTFTEVDPPHLLAYTQHADPRLGTPEMHVRVELADLGSDRTELMLTHSGIPSEALRGIIEGGWTNSLGLLADGLGSRAREVVR